MRSFVWMFNLVIVAAIAGGGAVYWLGQTGGGEPATAPAPAERAAALPEDPAHDVAFSPPPDFVEEIDLAGLEIDPERAPSGIRVILADTQHDATGAEDAVYTRYVARPETLQTVDALAQFRLQFDPVHNRLEIHHVRVTRDGVTEDRLERVAVDFARREELLDQQILTGTVTAILRYGEVRPGDIVDIGATLYGAPSAFAGVSTQLFQPATVLPIDTYALRSRWPRGSRWALLGNGPEVDVRETRRELVLEIAPQPLAPRPQDAVLPAWYAAWPILIVSEFDSWEDIARWGRPLFEEDLNEEIADIAAEIADQYATPAEQAAAALRFVQTDIRYFATVLGDGGYVPQRTRETLRLRTGDCKAKTLLFLSLLAALDIDAHAALVSAAQGPVIDRYAPTPLAFDHVIARVRIGGRDYWLDPTFSPQSGTLESITQPDYGFALPLDGRTGALVDMDIDRGDRPMSVLRERYELSESDDSIDLHIDYIQAGIRADEFRSLGLDVTDGAFGDALTRYYAQTYGAAEILETPRLIDDDVLNQIIVSMVLRVGGDLEREAPLDSFHVQAHGLANVLPDIGDADREMPMVAAFPLHLRHEITVDLGAGRDWTVPDLPNTRIENDVFRFEVEASLDGAILTYAAELESRVAEVPPETIEAALADHRRLTDYIYLEAWAGEAPTKDGEEP
ncbi:DUF3857 domain-containing protein [Hyphobacterium marinum]|uniref:DUF3857 domain-containing protein n=1 Tax=Hyphobacterium marinum TaxID=3116574 RepID=A0ABU7LYW5_9PROT|nr:DUF3857 domain-containing protein [Hyphobacterium sp. Y6023]MEE2566756.1 DUF3857 domain-containing protein [Hyphobacterium sp. Y6023]